MKEKLTVKDLETIKESIHYSKLRIENYVYEDYAIKQKKMKDLEDVLLKIKILMKDI